MKRKDLFLEFMLIKVMFMNVNKFEIYIKNKLKISF